MFELSWVLSSINGKLVETQNFASLRKSEGINFSGVSTDSRRAIKDELFFALSGDNFDGHDFVPDALGKGAKGAVVEKAVPAGTNGKVIIEVPSTLRALGDLASAWRKSFPDLKVAAITGSNGKTTTKEMTSGILSLRFNPSTSSDKTQDGLRQAQGSGQGVLKNSGNFNNLIGLPLTLLKLRDGCNAAVVELGMNEFGEIRRLAEIALPDVGAITNVGRAHLEKLGGIEGVARAKGELVERFTESNTFVVNMDNPWTRRIAEGVRCQKIRFGIDSTEGVDISATDVSPVDFSGIKFKMTILGKELPVRIRGIGIHNVMNALCAGGVALSLGCSGDEIQAGLERFSPAYMRLEVMNTPFGFKVINDAYNANPDSMRKAIEELMRLKGGGKGIAVVGDMLELGDASESEHRSLGEFICDSKVDFVIAYGKHAKYTLDATQGRVEGAFAETHERAAEILTRVAKPEDLVLVKGSRSMRMENVIQKLFKG